MTKSNFELLRKSDRLVNQSQYTNFKDLFPSSKLSNCKPINWSGVLKRKIPVVCKEDKDFTIEQ